MILPRSLASSRVEWYVLVSLGWSIQSGDDAVLTKLVSAQMGDNRMNRGKATSGREGCWLLMLIGFGMGARARKDEHIRAEICLFSPACLLA